MPGLDAREIRRLIRGGRRRRAAAGRSPPLAAAAPGAPVICLTAGEAAHAAQGLRPQDIGVGQDACLARPFGPRTLVSRVQRRAVPPVRGARRPRPHTAGRLRLEPARRRATLDGVPTRAHRHRVRRAQSAWCAARAGRCRGTALRHAGLGRGRRGHRRGSWTSISRSCGPNSARGHGIRTVRGIGYVMDPGAAGPGPASPRTASNPGGRPAASGLPLRSGAQGIRSEGTAEPRERARRDPGRRARRP